MSRKSKRNYNLNAEQQAAYKHMQDSLRLLDPMDSQHIAPIPYGVAYSKAKMFDMINIGTGKRQLEPEDMLEFVSDPLFCNKKYKGKCEDFNKSLIAQFLNGKNNSARADVGLTPYQYSYLTAKDFVLSVALAKAWRQYKYVFAPDALFVEHLMDAKDFTFAPEVFRFLPTNHFFIDFKNLKLPLDGVFISIMFDETSITVYASYVDESDVKEGFEFMGSGDGGSQFLIAKMNRNETYSFEDWMSLLEVLGHEVPARRFGLRSEIAVSSKEFETGKYARMLTIKLLMYLASSNPDIEMDKYWKRQKSRLERLHKDVSDIPEEWTVGARYGSVIRQNSTKSISEYGGGTHKSPKAHIRSAHFHLYWKGKNRQVPSVKFLSPIVVNGNKEIVPVIHRMTDAEPKGSFGEELIKEYLVKNDYDFSREKYAREIRKRYDFAVNVNGQTVYIEFDGQQHFKPIPNWGGHTGYNERRESDEIKNAYCVEHNIPLLRIRYDQKVEIDGLMDAFLKNPKIGEWNPKLSNDEYYSVCAS